MFFQPQKLFPTQVWPVPFLCAQVLSLATRLSLQHFMGPNRGSLEMGQGTPGMLGCCSFSLTYQQQRQALNIGILWTKFCCRRQNLHQPSATQLPKAGALHPGAEHGAPLPAQAPPARQGKASLRAVSWVLHYLIMMRLQSDILLLFSCWQVVYKAVLSAQFLMAPLKAASLLLPRFN